MEVIKITDQEKEMFNYLNDLRCGGKTNMFGAGLYLVDEFGIEKDEASKVLFKWMKHFNEDGYDHLT